MMRRRTFIAGLGSSAAWPVAARAQQGARMRGIGVLMSLASDDAEGQGRNAALLQGLGGLGWIVGRNVWMEYRWAAGNSDLYRRYADGRIGAGHPRGQRCFCCDRATADEPHGANRIASAANGWSC